MMQTQCWSSKAAGQERVWRMAEKAGRRWSKENVCRQTAVTVQRHAAFRKTQILSASKSNRETSETQDIFSLNFCRRLNVRKKKITSRTREKLFSSAEWNLPAWIVSWSDCCLRLSSLHRKPRDVSVSCKLRNHRQRSRYEPQYRTQVCAGA